MTISIDWENTWVIDVDSSELVFDRVEPVSGRSIYTHDINDFRLKLRVLESSEAGTIYPVTHKHVTELGFGTFTLVRAVLILPPYSIRYPDSAIGVELKGVNTNIDQFTVINSANVRPSNTAGNTISKTGISGLTAEESAALLIQTALVQADEFYDSETGLLHYYARGTTIDLIPPKTVTGVDQTQDASALE